MSDGSLIHKQTITMKNAKLVCTQSHKRKVSTAVPDKGGRKRKTHRKDGNEVAGPSLFVM